MKIINIVVFLVITSCLDFSCKSTEKISKSISNNIAVLIDPLNYNKFRFNPEWISANEISRIIEHDYLFGKSNPIQSITVLDYDKIGYLTTKSVAAGNPGHDQLNECNLFARNMYDTKTNDSFVIQSYSGLIYPTLINETSIFDTFDFGVQEVFNIAKAKEYRDADNVLQTRYFYDDQNRIVKEIDGDNKELYTMIYHSDKEIEIKQYSGWDKKILSIWVTKDNQGKIVKIYEESFQNSHEFKYNDKGYLLEHKYWIYDKCPKYHLYEYI